MSRSELILYLEEELGFPLEIDWSMSHMLGYKCLDIDYLEEQLDLEDDEGLYSHLQDNYSKELRDIVKQLLT